MRVVSSTASSLDGFIADDRHSLQWLFDVPGDAGSSFDGFLAGVGALLLRTPGAVNSSDVAPQLGKMEDILKSTPPLVLQSLRSDQLAVVERG